MLKALTKEIKQTGATDISSWRELRQEASVAAGHLNLAAEYAAHLRGAGVADYHLEANEKLPREVENDLEMFGCVSCNFCITVCPNDAFFSIPSLVDTGLDSMENSRQQYFVLSELCNECGNCMTFCPENGDPAVVKPRIYTNAEVYESRDTPGVLLGNNMFGSRGIDEESFNLISRLLTNTKGPLGK